MGNEQRTNNPDDCGLLWRSVDGKSSLQVKPSPSNSFIVEIDGTCTEVPITPMSYRDFEDRLQKHIRLAVFAAAKEAARCRRAQEGVVAAIASAIARGETITKLPSPIPADPSERKAAEDDLLLALRDFIGLNKIADVNDFLGRLFEE